MSERREYGCAFLTVGLLVVMLIGLTCGSAS